MSNAQRYIIWGQYAADISSKPCHGTDSDSDRTLGICVSHRHVLKWIRGNCERRLIVVFLGCSTSFFYWPHEIVRSNQNSVFQKCEPVVYAKPGLWNDDYGTRTKLHWLVWVHQAWRYAKHIENVLSLTRYEKLMSLIGYCIKANQLWYKHIVPQ